MSLVQLDGVGRTSPLKRRLRKEKRHRYRPSLMAQRTNLKFATEPERPLLAITKKRATCQDASFAVVSCNLYTIGQLSCSIALLKRTKLRSDNTNGLYRDFPLSLTTSSHNNPKMRITTYIRRYCCRRRPSLRESNGDGCGDPSSGLGQGMEDCER
jgi:hypothetical protein